MINLQGVEGNLSWIYILIRKIDGAVLPAIFEMESLPRWHQAFEFFKPVEDNVDLGPSPIRTFHVHH